jgi:type IV secretory pathway TrbL component
MTTAKLFPATLLAAALACSPAFVTGQSSTDKDAARQDAHQAGRDAKDAAKDTGHAVKHGTAHAYHKTKRGVKKAGHKTKGAVRGAKNGAEDSH